MKNNKGVDIIGAYLLIFLIVMVGLPTYVYFRQDLPEIIKLLVYVFSSGSLGGTVYCIRSFYQEIARKRFDFIWKWWYIFRPLIGGVIGVFSYFLIVGGLMSIGNIENINLSKSIFFYCGISFLAGFSFTQFTNKLVDLTNTIFSKKQEDKK